MDRSDESAELKILDRAECMSLLASQQVGRLVSAGPNPEIRPVNFVLVGSDIYVRSDSGSHAVAGGQVLFEVDHFDAGDRDGWSVIVAGRAAAVTDPAIIDEVVERLTPWAPGTKSAVSQIVIDSVSGRWVRAARQAATIDERGYL